MMECYKYRCNNCQTVRSKRIFYQTLLMIVAIATLHSGSFAHCSLLFILYRDLPKAKVSDRVAWRRLGLAGNCQGHEELPMYHLILWETTHSKRRPGRPSITFVDTLKRDVGVANTAEPAACMTNCDHWASRSVARLRSP